ncbi:uncharacterized protein JCM15063_002114 [Sporobolomyces koalae]|uniref:uncharacterized protein n=1 Tax=Sporobolomyces koalae TaxID=500713 RepID=UPI00317956CD
MSSNDMSRLSPVSSVDNEHGGSSEGSEPTTDRPAAPTSLAARFRNLCNTSPDPTAPTSLTKVQSVAAIRPVSAEALVPKKTYRPRIRPSQVRSCDQCRTSKQKPCFLHVGTMRRIVCTWSQAGDNPPVPRPNQLAANHTEIVRLRKEVDTLSRILRLTPHELEMFELEAKRLAEPTNSAAISAAGSRQKRSRNPENEPELGVDERSHKTVRREERSIWVSSGGRPRTYPAFSHVLHSRKAIPTIKVNGTRLATEPSRPVSVTTRPSLEHGRPNSRSPSFSTLPPLKIPSLPRGLTSSVPKSSLPSVLDSPRFRSVRSPSRATSSSALNASPLGRRPQYVLPTPVYSSTPTSASFYSLFSTPYAKMTVSPGFARASKAGTSSSEHKSDHIQPYTPLSAVRDEKRVENKQIEQLDPEEEEEPKEGQRREVPRISLPTVVSPSLKNLLND